MGNESILKLLTALENESASDYNRIIDIVRQKLAVEPEVQMMITVGTKIIYANKRLCDMMKYDCDDLIFHDVTNLITSQDREILNAWIQRMRQKGNVDYMIRAIMGDGNYIWLNVSSICLNKYNMSFSFLTDAGVIPTSYNYMN